MSYLERCRRVATVALVGALLALLPQIAIAGYTTPKSAVQSVSTGSMVAPTTLVGTWQCKTTGQGDTFDAQLTNWTDNGPAGASYRIELTSSNGFSQVVTTGSRTATLAGSQPKSNSNTTWTVSISAVRYQWTSPALVENVVCSRTGGTNGSF